MMNDKVSTAQTMPAASSIDRDMFAIGGAVLLGLTLLFAAGFAQASVMHDSAHDMRHAMSFPCH